MKYNRKISEVSKQETTESDGGTSRSLKSADHLDEIKLTNLKKVMEEKDFLISKQNEEIRSMKSKLIETNNDIFALTEEIAVLKQDLGMKFKHIKHLKKEKKELLEELEAKEMINNDIGRQSVKLENIFVIEKEKLKLADYENSFKDRKILSLERQLKNVSEESENQMAQQSSQRRKLSWKRVGNLAKEITPEDLDRLRQRSKGHHRGHKFHHT